MNKLENISVKKLLVQLIIPSLVTAIVSGSYNLVDGIFIGQTLGLEGNSANTYTFMIYALVYAFSALASEGTASLLTISLGKKDYKNARLILDSSIQVSLILSILQSILLWFSLEGLLIIFGAPQELYHYVKEFCLTFLIGAPIYFVSHTLLYCLRAQGKIKEVLHINAISFLVNAGTGAVLILVFHTGFFGSALSTVLANLAALILIFREYTGKSNDLKIDLKSLLFIDKKLINKIIAMGLPFFLTTVISVILLILYNRVAFDYAGTYGLAALSITSSIYRYIISLMNAITNGVQPVISFNYGAKNYSRIKQSLSISLIISTIFSLCLFLVIQIFAVQIATLFNSSDPKFIKFSSTALRLVMISLPVQGIINIGTNYFQYISFSRISTFLVILRQIIFQIPLALFLPILFGITGLWSSYFISDFLILVIIMFWLKFMMTKLRNIMEA